MLPTVQASVGSSVIGVLMVEAFGARSIVAWVVAVSVLAELYGVWSANVDGVRHVIATEYWVHSSPILTLMETDSSWVPQGLQVLSTLECKLQSVEL